MKYSREGQQLTRLQRYGAIASIGAATVGLAGCGVLKKDVPTSRVSNGVEKSAQSLFGGSRYSIFIGRNGVAKIVVHLGLESERKPFADNSHLLTDFTVDNLQCDDKQLNAAITVKYNDGPSVHVKAEQTTAILEKLDPSNAICADGQVTASDMPALTKVVEKAR